MPSDTAPALGIDLGGTKIEAVVLGDAGSGPRFRERVATPREQGYGAILHAIAALVDQARATCGPRLSIGIGTPGTATASGLMKNSNTECLNGQPLQADLARVLGQPVALANDANCLALSEATDGAGAGADVVLAVILGTGCGGGLALHGRVHGGPNGVAGEWGHNPLPWRDEDPDCGPDPVHACYCGQRGCIETLVAGPALARDHALTAGQPCTAPEIVSRALAGDPAAQATLDRHASRLARALASTINLLDPDVIVLGGGVSQLPGLIERVTSRWRRWVVSGGVREPVRTALRIAHHGDASGVRGAAWLGRALGPG
jgi:fructokinase